MGMCYLPTHIHDTKSLTLRHTEGYYVGITNSNAIVEWYDPKTKIVQHRNTVQFDEYRTHVGDDNPMPGALAIGVKLVVTSNLPSITTNTSYHPYFSEPPKLFQVPLPQKGQDLGLEIIECDNYLLPFINNSKAGFPFHKHIPSDYRNN
eukprot:8567853-Ditylum_brightwellii.AAC.2